tara:strand:+ start:5962 stop:7011 length:1050 start_codon:yes stop_codon:yes gene_type:complete
MTASANKSEKDLVTVTGASGFIATHCILNLLQAGYRVRGTVRSFKRREEIETGIGAHVDIGGRLEFVEADLLQDEGWAEAVEGARYVLHVASPLPSAPPDDEMELITPAREGALRVLRAASDAGVERVVLTSSLAAVTSGHERPPSRIFDEGDWSDLSRPMGAYEKSKTMAERAAWDFVESLPAGKRLELVTMNPGVVLGPSLIPDYSMSAEFVGKLLRKDVPGCPKINIAPTDVRDVAAAHVAAMQLAEANGKRFILAGENTPMRDIALVLRGEFGPRGYRVPTMQLPNLLIRLVAKFDKAIGLIVPELGRPTNVSSKRAEQLLGYQHRSLHEMVVSTADSLIHNGLA